MAATTAAIVYSVPNAFGITEDIAVTFEPHVQYISYRNFTVDINVTDLTGLGVVSFEFTLTFPEMLVDILGVNAVGLTAGQSLSVNTTVAGQVTVAFATASALSGSGTLCQLQFYAKRVIAESDSGALAWSSFQFNEGTPSNYATNGSVQIIGNPAVPAEYSYSAINGQTPRGATAIVNYVGISANPVVDGSGIGFGIPPNPIVYSAVTPSSSLGVLVGVADTPSMNLSGVDATAGATPTTGTATTPSMTYVAIDSDAPQIGLGTTPVIVYEAQTPTELTFGTPRNVKLESFATYSLRLSVTPKVFDGVINKGETTILKGILRDDNGEIVSFSGVLYFLVQTPNRTVEGPFAATEVKTGHYEYEYTPAEKGPHCVRMQDALYNVVEERDFKVAESKVLR